MQSKFSRGLVAVLLYAQGLLGFAAVATVVMQDRPAIADARTPQVNTSTALQTT